MSSKTGYKKFISIDIRGWSIISFIEDHKVIDRIIAHPELTFEAEQPPPSRVVQQALLMAAEEMGEYF